MYIMLRVMRRKESFSLSIGAAQRRAEPADMVSERTQNPSRGGTDRTDRGVFIRCNGVQFSRTGKRIKVDFLRILCVHVIVPEAA